MKSWFESLLGINNQFMPYGHCYLWRPDILWTHVVADGITTVAYIAIPISILIIAWRHSLSTSNSIGLLFAGFIVLCGLTHLINIYVIWQPAYEFQSYIKAATALISIITAVVITGKTPYFIELLQMERSLKNLQEIVVNTEKKEEQLKQIYSASEYREMRIIELKEEINQLLLASGQEIKYSHLNQQT